MYVIDLDGKHSAIKVFNQRRDAAITCEYGSVVRNGFVKLNPGRSSNVKFTGIFLT